MCVTKGGRQGEGGVTAGHSGGERVCVLQREEGRGREGSQRVTECVCVTKGGRQGEGGVTAGHSGSQRGRESVCVLQREIIQLM